MTVNLYKWNRPEQIKQLRDYLLQNTPSSSSNVGFLLNIGSYDGSENVDILTSQVDPFETTDIVVWICDYGDGIRVFVNSEFVLDNAELRPETKGHVFNNTHANVPFFKSKKDEDLFRKSLGFVEQVIISFMEERKLDVPIFGDVNLLWLSVFHKHFQLTLDLPHCRLAKQASLPISVVKIPDHLELTTIATDQDILTVQANNKNVFSVEYIKDCSRLSSAIRQKKDGSLVAWAMTHPDFSIGALYVMPEFRRQGLAEAVVMDISRVYTDYYRKKLPDVSLSRLYFNVFIEITNKPSLGLFEKSGFQHVSLGTSRIRIAGNN